MGMPEVHTKIAFDASGNQVVFHNSGQVFSPPSTGQPVVAIAKPVGQANTTVHGQVSGITVVFDNPG